MSRRDDVHIYSYSWMFVTTTRTLLLILLILYGNESAAALQSSSSPNQRIHNNSQRIHTGAVIRKTQDTRNTTTTVAPTHVPSDQPTNAASTLMVPSKRPSATPTAPPTTTKLPTNEPSIEPTRSLPPSQSSVPSSMPTHVPSSHPTHAPSTAPTGSFQPTATPTDTPSYWPSQFPTVRPSVTPSINPSASPSTSHAPTESQQPSHLPTVGPSVTPSVTPSLSPSTSHAPSDTQQPSDRPTLSNAPSDSPSDVPSFVPSYLPSVLPSFQPSASPSLSVQPTSSPSTMPSRTPSNAPSLSQHPSFAPTNKPSFTPTGSPSLLPTAVPSDVPTREPSSQPSISLEPSFVQEQTMMVSFSQIFMRNYTIGSTYNLNSTQQEVFVHTIESLLPLYIEKSNARHVEVRCEVMKQVPAIVRSFYHNTSNYTGTAITTTATPTTTTSESVISPEPAAGLRERSLETQEIQLTIEYTLSHRSQYLDVSTYTNAYKEYMKQDSSQAMVLTQLNDADAGLEITDVSFAALIVEDSTVNPSNYPSTNPSILPPPSLVPSASPSESAITENESTNVYLIVGVTCATVGFAVAVCIAICCVRKRIRRGSRKLTDQDEVESSAVGPDDFNGNDDSNNRDLETGTPDTDVMGYKVHDDDNIIIQRREYSDGSSDVGNHYEYRDDNGPYMKTLEEEGIPMNESIISNPSLLSPGMSYRSDELQFAPDEFDVYRDSSLEKMRREVENAVTDSDAMMSQALTKALMDDEEYREKIDHMWGGSGSSIEIEASVLCDTHEFLKRKDDAGLDEKRVFMQELVNKMVAGVRYELIGPEGASRTIHGCAAMLRLELAESIPEKALIITGLRKMVKRQDLIDSFSEFGELEDAAVASNSRGFGLVRYRSVKSVLRAIERFKRGEIVVQDVAVMVKKLSSDYNESSRGHGNPRRVSYPIPRIDQFHENGNLGGARHGQHSRNNSGVSVPASESGKRPKSIRPHHTRNPSEDHPNSDPGDVPPRRHHPTSKPKHTRHASEPPVIRKQMMFSESIFTEL